MSGFVNDEEEWVYVGEWVVEEFIVFKGIENDKGFVVKNFVVYYVIFVKFFKKIDNKGKIFVVQYEVKLQSRFFVCMFLKY